MKNKTIKDTGSDIIRLSIVGASLAGVAAITYFLFGPKGKIHQKHLKSWAIKMKGDIVEKLETAREVSEPVYHEIIDSVASEYKKGMKAGKEEVEELAKDLKKHWKTLVDSSETIKVNAKEGVKRVIKKAKL
jgi:gas vesicle protein